MTTDTYLDTADPVAYTTQNYRLTTTPYTTRSPYEGNALGCDTGYSQSTTPAGICAPNTHYFECRHAERCYCGATARTPAYLGVPAGL